MEMTPESRQRTGPVGPGSTRLPLWPDRGSGVPSRKELYQVLVANGAKRLEL